jgi:flagellar hook-length control protein FliK
MAREGIQHAALKLNPANLGPVEVRLNMHNEQANITFIAHNAATRDALEQALPKLRESFLENGLELTDADVSDPSSQQAKDDEAEQGGEETNGNLMASTLETVNEKTKESATMVDDTDLGLSVYA